MALVYVAAFLAACNRCEPLFHSTRTNVLESTVSSLKMPE